MTATELIKDSQKILIAGHLGPDFDAYASLLFTGLTIRENFPEKQVIMLLDTASPLERISYLRGYNDIVYSPLMDKVNDIQPDLVILVDGQKRSRFTDKSEELKQYQLSHKSILFDHHPVDETDFTFHLQKGLWSCVEVVYTQLIKNEGLKLFNGWEEIFLTGLIGDSLRFYHKIEGYRETFSIVSDILDKGYQIGPISDRLFGYTREDLIVYSLFSKHVIFEEGFVYAYITRDEFDKEIAPFVDMSEYRKAKRDFIDLQLNKVIGCDLSFLVAPDVDAPENDLFTCSLRSKQNTIDTSVIAREFPGGGGHVTGSGFSLKANTIEDAIQQVKEAIKRTEKTSRIQPEPQG